MRVRLFALQLLAAGLAFGTPLTAGAGHAQPAQPPASAAPARAAPPTAADSLTLYSEPGFKGRHATYHFAAVEVERQGFVARSAASSGMWTLCEGGQVVSRCQTVNGQASELRLAPQLVRPGLNALALYDQPGLKGRSIIYSFAADRPAPFHARSARTWGGPWSVCERSFKRCQMLDGKSASIDLVVGAVRPERATASTPAPAPVNVRPLPVKTQGAPAAKAMKPAPLSSPKPPKPLSVQAHVAPVKATPPPRPLRAQRLVHVAEPRKAPPPPRHLVIQFTSDVPMHRRHEARSARRDSHAVVAHAARRSLLTPVRRETPRSRDLVSHHRRQTRLVRDVRPIHHLVRPRLAHMVSDHPRRHGPHRRLYRRVRMYWGGPDPYLYDSDPRDDGPGPW
jgi:hypothetical protein